jgi:hypothetical protein
MIAQFTLSLKLRQDGKRGVVSDLAQSIEEEDPGGSVSLIPQEL